MYNIIHSKRSNPKFFYADLPIDNVRLLTLVSGSDHDNFLAPNDSKFSPEEWDWNSKIPFWTNFLSLLIYNVSWSLS